MLEPAAAEAVAVETPSASSQPEVLLGEAVDAADAPANSDNPFYGNRHLRNAPKLLPTRGNVEQV